MSLTPFTRFGIIPTLISEGKSIIAMINIIDEIFSLPWFWCALDASLRAYSLSKIFRIRGVHIKSDKNVASKSKTIKSLGERTFSI